MALQNCEECGNQVSSSADNCPNCGAPVKKKRIKIGCWGIGCLGLIIIPFVLMLMAIMPEDRIKKSEKTEKAAQEVKENIRPKEKQEKAKRAESAVVYDRKPYVKKFYKNKNWTVMQMDIAGESRQCLLRSSPHYIDDRGKNPDYGTTYLKIGYPNNIVTFSGENIGLYFSTAELAILQVDDGMSFAIKPEEPITDKNIIDSLIKGKTAKIKINFKSGDPSIHTFSLIGFTDAYKKLLACPGTPAAPKADTPPLAVNEPVYDPIQKWGKEKVASAQKVMTLVSQDCRIYEEDTHLVVEMQMYVTDPNQRLRYVRAIADADVILQGKPRNIYFYDPSNKQIAQADPLNGVRLID